MEKIIKKKIKIPTIPSFIRVGEEGNSDESIILSIQDFTEEELQKIGEEWTKKLIEKSKFINK